MKIKLLKEVVGLDLGFSVYLGEAFDETYIDKMLNHGFRYIFTSLQIPEDNQDTYLRG